MFEFIHNDRTWWIDSGKWDESKGSRVSEMYRTIGTFDVDLGGSNLFVHAVEGSNQVRIEEYLSAFESDLIWLIFGFGGGSGKASAGDRAKELASQIKAFTAASKVVLTNPARELRAARVEGNWGKVRPSMETLRQHLAGRSSHRVVGRGVREVVATPDNGYLLHMTKRCKSAALRLRKAAVLQSHKLSEWSEKEGERATGLEGLRERYVDPAVFEQQQEERKELFAAVNAWSDGEDRSTSEYFTCTLLWKSRDGGFCFDHKKCEPPANVKYGFVRLPENLTRMIERIAPKDRGRLSICGKFDKQIVNQNWIIDPYFIHSIHLAPKTPADIQKASYASSNWTRRLSTKELEEARSDAATARLRSKALEASARDAANAAGFLDDVLAELRRQEELWRTKGVKEVTAFPLGVRFSRNPKYAACWSAFKKVKGPKQGEDNHELPDLRKWGVTHASRMYEYWCLAQILSSLMDAYRFTPERDWSNKLVSSLFDDRAGTRLTFKRDDVGMSAVLEMQPTLPNGRRPDFRLTFEHTRSKPATLVLDAKFRTKWKDGELSDVLDELVDVKRYGHGGAKVFILQPLSNQVDHPNSPLGWGRHCDYGQSPGDNHERGFVTLSPHSSRTGLDRLLAMLIQQASPTPPPRKPGEMVRVPRICIQCGAGTAVAECRETSKDNRKWIIRCDECGGKTERTHCCACGVPLYKNGQSMTYHSTLAEQITNVICFGCGAYLLAEDSNNERL